MLLLSLLGIVGPGVKEGWFCFDGGGTGCGMAQGRMKNGTG